MVASVLSAGALGAVFGATLRLLLVPPGSGALVVTPAMTWARAVLAAVAALGAAAVVTRYVLAGRSRA
jgi:hypothetical protein